MVVGWTEGKNKIIDALVARIAALETTILQLQDENTKKKRKNQKNRKRTRKIKHQ